jgi:phosphonatase-like hydrolase
MTATEPIQLVVFDVAGTTVMDGDLVIDAMEQALRHAEVPANREAVRALMGLPKPIAIRQLLNRHADRVTEVDRLVDDVSKDFLRHLMEGYRTAPVAEAPGACDVFRHLHARGIKVALDTGFSRCVLDLLLDRLKWTATGLVDCSVASDEVAHGRPAADLIQRAMHATGVVRPAAVAKVGDTPADIQSGRAAECGFVVAVTYGTHSRRELMAHHPDVAIDALSDLVPLVTSR